MEPQHDKEYQKRFENNGDNGTHVYRCNANAIGLVK